MELFSGCNGRELNNGLAWLNEPAQWNFDRDGALTIVPRAKEDFFRPCQGQAYDNAPMLYKQVEGDFTAVTRTKAKLADFGDAAALTIRADSALWAKICMERSPSGQTSLVSVVTSPWSDDANNELLSEPDCFMRLTRKGNLLGMHYSLDGSLWRFVRSFALELPHTAMVGVHAQAPIKQGCQVKFFCFNITDEAVEDFRSGE